MKKKKRDAGGGYGASAGEEKEREYYGGSPEEGHGDDSSVNDGVRWRRGRDEGGETNATETTVRVVYGLGEKRTRQRRW